VVLGQEVSKFMVGGGSQRHLLPQVRCQVGVGLGNGSVSCLGEVAEGSGGATSRRVAILDTGHGEELLGHRGRHDASTTRGRNETDQN
jgi:hypothetical protein